MIIDIHTHAFPDALAPRAIAALSACAGIPAYTDGTCEGLRASMRPAGIDCSVIMPIATKPSQVRAINAWATEVNRQYDDLLSFGTLHPRQEDWADEIDRLVQDGIPGVKLHPEYQEFYVDDPSMRPLYRALADAGRILLFHAGVDIGIPPPVHCTPEQLVRVLEMAPGLQVIAAHMGGYRQWDEVERWLIGRDIYLDTSYSLPELGAERMMAMIRAHGIDRVLFGSDTPWEAQASSVASLRELALPDAEAIAVLGRNAETLLAGCTLITQKGA